MTEKIILGETVRGAKSELDLQELITGRTLLCCISRWGKTWTARRIVEQAFGKTGIIIVDVEGEYATLRDRFPLLIIGKDVPLVPESAEFLADQVLEHDLSVIIDGSDPNLDIAAFQEFIARFIDRFIAIETHARKPYLWILEEADELAPETGIARSMCLNQIRKLVKKGGKRGLGAMVLTQRPAFVSKFVISQAANKIIGRTEWPDDLTVLRKFGRVPARLADPESSDPHALKNLEKGQFYVSGDFIAKDELVQVGPVSTKHLGATPEIVPPAPRELKEVLAQLSEKLPSIIREQIAPAVPRVAEIEARLKDKFEAQWQVRLARKDKEVASIKAKTEAKDAVEIADLKRKLEDATRHSAMRGPVTDLLEHPLVKKNLEKLSDKQCSFVELLESKGAQDPERCSLFLEINPKSVPTFVHEVNRKIPKLIENVGGRYASRLAKLFPVTEEAQAETKESDRLRGELATVNVHMKNVETLLENTSNQLRALSKNYDQVVKERDVLRTTNQRLIEIAQGKAIPAEDAKGQLRVATETGVPAEGSATEQPAAPASDTLVPVEATLRRTLTRFNVATNTEILDADESTPIGRILASGLRGFFQEEQGISAIAGEILRKYSIAANSGGNKAVYQKALEELVAKDILDRRNNNGAWVYKATAHFRERVRPLQEAVA